VNASVVGVAVCVHKLMHATSAQPKLQCFRSCHD
jgi:hypothetical protein